MSIRLSFPRRRESCYKDTGRDWLCRSPLRSGSRLRGNDNLWRALPKQLMALLVLMCVAACGVQGELKRPSEMSEKEKQEAWW